MIKLMTFIVVAFSFMSFAKERKSEETRRKERAEAIVQACIKKSEKPDHERTVAACTCIGRVHRMYTEFKHLATIEAYILGKVANPNATTELSALIDFDQDVGEGCFAKPETYRPERPAKYP